jgi:hypothetical protein
MSDCHPVGISLDPGIQLRKEQPEDIIDSPTTYQSIIGSLMYACIGTRPDLTFTIMLLSQFFSCPNTSHLAVAKRVLRYLKGTKDYNLFYPQNNDAILHRFSDASYGNFLDDRKSCSGYMFRLGDATISWCAQKQKSVAVSTTKAEYMALSLSARHMIWFTTTLIELKQDYEAIIHADSSGAIDISRNSKVSQCSKHIDIHYHFVREHVDKTFKLEYIPTKENVVDLLTKTLNKQLHECLTRNIMMQ